MSDYRIDVTVQRPWGRRLPKRSLSELAGRVLASEGVPAPAGVSIVVADDETVRELNRRHLRVDAPTDVLSFPLPGADGFPDGGLGEVIVAAPTAARQAAAARHSLADEVAHLVVHGLLHLLGYDHASRAGERRMRAREDELLGRKAH